MAGGPANGLTERFLEAFHVARHSADPASVQKAIDLGRAVLAAEDVPERDTVLSHLGGLLQTRYHQTGDVELLREAVGDVTEAYLLSYESPQDTARYAGNIGMLLHTAFLHDRDRGTLADALDWSRTAVEQAIHDTLGWLSDTVAGAVLGEPGLTAEPAADGPWPRIWWAPVGSLSLLPLHAAGHHRDGGPVLLDRVVSSTTPTIRALGHARAGRRDDREEPRLLVVAMPRTPHAPDLPGAQAEADHLAALVPDATVLAGADATCDAVLDALPGSGWAHFACHGNSDPDNPSDSHLALHDHDHDRAPLRVRDISRLRLRNARFAFLSACDTARTTARLSDEAIHPLAAFQIAGFSQVVGTLWRVDDAVAPALSRQIYGELVADRSGALCASVAVHRTVRQLRSTYPNLPSVWAAHVHAGA